MAQATRSTRDLTPATPSRPGLQIGRPWSARLGRVATGAPDGFRLALRFRAVLSMYLPFLRPGGKVFLVCPQERGYASDPTHVTFTSGRDLMALATDLGLESRPWRSFPLPRATGRWFTYNEFNVLAVKQDPAA